MFVNGIINLADNWIIIKQNKHLKLDILGQLELQFAGPMLVGL